MWRFNDIFKPTIWGGSKIGRLKKQELPAGIGECWEVSGVDGSESVVADGPDAGLTLPALVERYGAELMGKKNFSRYGTHFPLLVKIIDATDVLSVQVHPGDDLARSRGYANGKTEMWYILEADEGATIANGFRHPVDPGSYRDMVESGNIEDSLHFQKAAPGDVFIIPAGRVHSIGKGIFLVEIQQTSDITYRIYDYGRRDASGRQRELHADLAFDAINFNDTDGKAVEYTPHRNIPVNLESSPYFTTNFLSLNDKIIRDYSEWDTFVIIIATDGSATLRCAGQEMHLSAGQSALIPASAQGLAIEPDGSFSALETYIK